MTKEELEKYAHENRKRLDAQEVKIGDVVKVLRGQFAGETGVIVGIIVCGRDYADPYYEVDMDCEVPDKYKCRKNTLAPNNVIGGLSAYEFEVIGNRAPMQSTEEIKVGDKVRVNKDAPRIYTPDWVDEMFNLVLKVTKVEDGNAMVVFAERTSYKTVLTVIPTKYLIKVEDEAKEPKFNVGDKVVVHYSTGDKIGLIQEVLYDGCYDVDYGGGCTGHHIIESRLVSYTEPTAPTIKVGSEEWVDKQVWNCKLKQHGVIKRIANGCAEVFTQYGEHKVWSLVDLFDEYDEPFGKWKSVQPTEQTEAEKKPNIGSIKIPVEVDLTDSYWDTYTADLAKEIALKVANKYSDPKEAAGYAVSVAKSVVENLKKK
ncbi:hypothetical protein [uncultured Bacteroides sp.]|uniref:KOW motif-containing protein n=1 Tax=uncultured Bacteroides sp. TaxID=162156 RepID=UPI00260A36EE|nr:hypothetical protein [uncultured Bacteroides sp.]